MAHSRRLYFTGAALILLQVSRGIQARPFDSSGYLRVQSGKGTSVIQKDSGDKGIYNTRLENDVRPAFQPFPTDISYLVFQDSPGAVHPSVPHLDYPSQGNAASFGISICKHQQGKPCPGVPHVEGLTATEYSNETSISPPAGPVPVNAMADQDIFLPVSTDPIPSNISPRDDHLVRPDHIVNADGPISTNKFYSNFFLGSQTNYTFTHPYAVGWSKGNGTAKSYGMTISQVEAEQRASGDPSNSIPGNPFRYYINPIGIQSMILSAMELGESTRFTVSNPQVFSADAILRPQSDSQSRITFPVTQGMGFVTGIYNNLQPAIQTGVFFRGIEAAPNPRDGVFKFRATLEDGRTWLIYIIPEDGSQPRMEYVSNTLFRGPSGFKGIIQVAKNPAGETGEAIYDRSAGAYARSVRVSGSVNNTQGRYSFQWEKAGQNVGSVPLLVFALPHHVESFDEGTRSRATSLKLNTTTKGTATAYTGESWTMVESNLPIDMDLAPWSPGGRSRAALSEAAKQAIRNVAPSELSQNVAEQTDLDSMYFSGKALNKFAGLVYTIHELVQDPSLASAAFQTLKDSFDRFVQNRQRFPLAYDTVWKGVVSTGTYQTGDPGLDFGNTLYNDHHFHYGYFILAAAIIGRLDPGWLDANKAWVNMLVRDSCNPSTEDPLFPFSRGFDWYHGHSWAKGLFESLDGKDEESTSEDTMFAYALKMWGKTIGDASMEARGNLMLAILARSLNNYFLMKKDNVNQPKNFIDNKVTGILFENKVDHATYFGLNLEFIHGIHMLPLLPNSAYTRSAEFVREEWEAVFAPGAAKPAETVEGGWRGVLFANLALFDPAKAWDFFAQPNFDLAWIDGGASRSWYLAYTAALGGGPQQASIYYRRA